MRLACYLDMGNSRVKAWLCQDQEVIARYSFAHQLQPHQLFTELPVEFQQVMDFVGISSVLDVSANQHLAVLAEQYWQCRPQFAASQSMMHGITNAYPDYQQLGVDRWLNVLAVMDRQPCCVVSCGTALTIDALSQGQHLGGFIVPGLHLQLSSLVQGTRRVRPQLVSTPHLGWGTNTSTAVHHGIVLAAVATIEKARAQLAEQLQQPVQLVLTGGDAEKLAPHLQDHVIIPELLLLGLKRYFGHLG